MALGIAIAIVFTASLFVVFVRTPPERLARILRVALPIALGSLGVGLVAFGRGALGVPLIGLALAAWRRLRSAQPVSGPADQVSTVQTRFLRMTLDHTVDRLEGEVIEGARQGLALSDLDLSQLLSLRRDYARMDGESQRLLETYLDRRVPGWRGDAQANDGDGLGSTPRAGAMTEQEAYEILGLQPGATLAEIREAHRRLMKRVHPDSGGTDFLAARINEAKAFLVDRHH